MAVVTNEVKAAIRTGKACGATVPELAFKWALTAEEVLRVLAEFGVALAPPASAVEPVAGPVVEKGRGGGHEKRQRALGVEARHKEKIVELTALVADLTNEVKGLIAGSGANFSPILLGSKGAVDGVATLVGTFKTLVQLERQAYGLDTVDDSGGGDLAGELDRLARRAQNEKP